jgi:BirA family biotin operon repressor/biotin-[acetyl-CoA-carboxylase] ligase
MSASDATIIHAALLDHLLRKPAGVDVDEAASWLSLSPAQLGEELARLRAAGCELTASSPQHVRLGATGLSAWRDYLAWACPLPGRQRLAEVYHQVASTQDAARRLIGAHGVAADGALAIADEQTAGRGRLGRRWVAPPGACVLVSRGVVAEAAAPLSPDRLAMAAAVAVAAAVEAVTAPSPIPVGIKWPNDLLIDGRKLAGILVEAMTVTHPRHGPLRAAIIGVGVNVNLSLDQLLNAPAELRQRVTSLAMLGRPVDRLLVLAEIVRQLDAWLGECDLPRLLQAWRRRSVTLGRRIVVTHNGDTLAGQVIDVDLAAGLILRTDAGQVVVLPAATTAVVA